MGAILAVSLLSLAPSVSWADEARRLEAERAFRAGDQAYAAGQYLAAARAYEGAHALYPLPSITFSMAQAYRRHYFEDRDIAWLQKAEVLYQRYLQEEPKGGRRDHAITHLGNIALLIAAHQARPQEGERSAALTELLISSTTPGALASVDGGEPQEVPVVQKVTAERHRVTVSAPGFFDAEHDVIAIEGKLGVVPIDLEPRPGSLRVFADESAEVWVDGRRIGRAPMQTAVDLPAGNHWVSVSAPGRRPESRSVTIERGRFHTVQVELEASDQRVAATWTLAGAGAFALAGSVLAILAVSAEGDSEEARSGIDRQRSLSPDEAATSNDALARRDLTRSLSLVSFGISAAAGVTGTLLFVFDDPLPQAATGDTASTYGLGYVGAF